MARKIQKRKIEQKSVLIALEDSKSSRYYFQSLVKDKKLSGKVIFAKYRGSNPTKVLKTLEKHKTEDRKKKKSTIYAQEWIVIDRDSFPDFFSTIQKAKENNVCVAFSNESYELWLLLHFKLVSIHTDRDTLKSQLNNIFLNRFQKEYEKSSQDIYGLIIGLQDEAIKNAKILVAQHLENYRKIEPKNNPITMIYQLVECLNSLYSKKKKCNCFPTVAVETKGSKPPPFIINTPQKSTNELRMI